MHKYIFLVLIIFIFSCNDNQNKNSQYSEEQIASLQLDSTKLLNVKTDSVIRVDLNPFLKKQTFDFSSLVEEIKLIPLETTGKSLFNDILKILVTDSNIYIHDKFKGGGIIIFDSKGKFIKRIPNGKGPGELMRLYDIAYDKENNELIAYQHSFLLFFNPSGKFLRRIKLPFGFFNFTVIPEGYLFKSLDSRGDVHLKYFKDFTFFVTDKNFKLKSVGLPYSQSDVNLEGHNYLHNNNNTLLVTQKFTDTIYQYYNATNQLRAKYILDYNNKKLPEHYLHATWQEFENTVRKNDYFFYLGETHDNVRHSVFIFENWYTGLQTVVFRDKKSGNLIGGTNADYNWNEMPPIAFPKSVSGNYFISWYLTPSSKGPLFSKSSIITNEDKLRIKDLTENANPVLVFYKLKNF